MHVDALRLFLDVADTHSFTDAAHLHGCTPANASQSFHALEQHLGQPLAEPGLRRIILNDAGQVSYEYCREMVGLADAMVDKIAKIHEGSSSLEVAACPCIRLHRLPPLLDAFQQAFPGITVHAHLESHDGVHQAVLNNEVDAGLVPYPRHEPGLTAAIFRRVPLVLACHPDNPFAALPLVTIRHLKNRRVLVWNQIPWRSLLTGVRPNERHFYESRHLFGEVDEAIEAVMAGAGVAVLPASLVRAEVAQQRLVAVPFENGRHTVPVAAIHRKRRKLPPALKQFLQFLQLPEPGEKV